MDIIAALDVIRSLTLALLDDRSLTRDDRTDLLAVEECVNAVEARRRP